jgi:serine/threonine protein kinase/Flp pilus assembly protein TadD
MTSIPPSLSAALAGTYRLERQLGQGGMAVVYLATDLKHERQVALKVMHPELKGMLGPRFSREIKTAARLQHPHICSVYDSGETPDGELWYTMPYVSGETLRDRMIRERKMPVADVVRIIREAAQGLEYAHKQGVIHRDIKPENILLTEDGNTLVADFGIARAMDSVSGGPGEGGPGGPPSAPLTEIGTTVGTPAYMSPEQRLGDQISAASDVYSLAVVLYEGLAGEPVATGTGTNDLLALMRSTGPQVRLKRPEISPALDSAVRLGAHPDPAQRIPTMAAFGTALESALSGSHTVSSTPTRRRRALMAGAVAALVAASAAWYGLRGPAKTEVVTILPFSLASSPPGDSTLFYFTGAIGEDFRRMIPAVRGLDASTEAAVANVAGGRLSNAEIAARMGASIIVQPSASWEDSTIALSFQVSRPPAKQSTRVEFRGTPQWIVDHRDSLVGAVLKAGGHAIDREASATLVRWGIGTTIAQAYIRYWKYITDSYDVSRRGPTWVAAEFAIQDTLLRLDPHFVDVLSDKAIGITSTVRNSGSSTPTQRDTLRREVASLVKRASQVDATHPLTMRASGYHSLMINDTASALRAFAEVARQMPVFQTLTDLCSLELSRVRPSQPLPQSCTDQVRVDSLNPSSLTAAVRMLLANGRTEAALVPAKRLVAVSPNEVRYRLPLISTLNELGREEEAMVELRTALASSPNDPYLLWNMAETQWSLGLSAEALETTRRMVALNPGDISGQMRLSLVLSWMGRHEEALAQARATVAQDPDAPLTHWRLGSVLWRTEQFDAALGEFRRSAALDGNNLARQMTVIDYLRLAGRTGDAQGLLDQVRLQFAGSPQGATELAQQQAWLGQHAASAVEYRRGIGTDTLSAWRWNSVGYAEILAGQIDSALVHIRHAMTLDSFITPVIGNHALILALKGSNREAAQASDRRRARRPLDHDALGQQVWFHARAGDSAGARAMLDTLQQRMQRNGVSSLPLLIAYTGIGDTVKARAMLRRSVETRDLSWLRYSLSDPLFAMLRGTPEFAEAVRAFRQAGDR